MTSERKPGSITGGTGDRTPIQGGLFGSEPPFEPRREVDASSASQRQPPAVPARPAAGAKPGSAAAPRTIDPPRVGAARVSGLLDGLNAAQLEAATHENGPLLILAGPGSGKTRVITRRIAWLCTERGVDPWRILAITFTNKAAREMRERVEKLLPAQGAWISTFHAMCARILRREIEILPGYTRDFTIYDTSDRNQLLKQLLKDSDYDTTRFKPSMVGAWISARKNGLAEEDGALELVRTADEEGDTGLEAEVCVKIHARYEAALSQQNALDFDDLIVKVHAIFDRHPGIRDAYASRFLHVMVDEYQDTNHVQYRLTKALASVHGNLAVCGDPDQSIYAWRGADIRNILDFEKDFPGPRIVKLEQNYRSTTTILKAAQALIERNTERKPKDLWSEKGEGRKIVALQCADENDEAREIALQIQALQREGRSPRHIAVFYRVNFMQRALESALRMSRIPYQIVGGQEFYERREIRDLVAFAKLAVNPADDVAFRRVVNVPGRGIGEKSLDVLVEFARDRRLSLSQAVTSSEALARVKGRARGGLESFANLLGRLEPLKNLPAGVALEQILEEIGMESWLAEMDDDSGVDRQSNVDELVTFAHAYDVMAEESKRTANAAQGVDALEGGLRGFLQDIALVSDTDAMQDDTDKVTLMTLHSAKGLEYPVVFVAGLEEELLPHSRALSESRGSNPDAGLEEERRLFYVGITRAEERLFLTHAQQRLFFGEYAFRSPSRFLEEIPPRLLEGFESDRDESEMLGAYEPKQEQSFAVGDRVEHEHFGRGTIDRLQGSGVNARATVAFPAHGTKTLLLQYAKLKRLEKGQR